MALCKICFLRHTRKTFQKGCKFIPLRYELCYVNAESKQELAVLLHPLNLFHSHLLLIHQTAQTKILSL